MNEWPEKIFQPKHLLYRSGWVARPGPARPGPVVDMANKVPVDRVLIQSFFALHSLNKFHPDDAKLPLEKNGTHA